MSDKIDTLIHGIFSVLSLSEEENVYDLALFMFRSKKEVELRQGRVENSAFRKRRDE